MVAAAIGAALTAASAIYGGIKSAQANRKVQANNEAQRKKNQDWYDRRYNENPMGRADAQFVYQQVQDDIRKRNKSAQGTSAVMGGPIENVAAVKEANNEALANTAAQIVANNEARKDNIEATYLQNDNTFTDKESQYEAARANNIAQAVKGVAGAGASIASSFNTKSNSSIFDVAREANTAADALINKENKR